MSSSSSSECMCPACSYYDANHRPIQMNNPFYETLGQPLIYYAQVRQQSRNGRCKRSNKGSPNCFVKAFRWYTQERLPRQSEAHTRREFCEFASWLDKKYDEFLEHKQSGECCQTWPKEPSPCPADKNTSEPCAPCETKIFARVKSPWRKKHSSKERIFTIEKHLQSLEFIMEPKELSCPVSEYNQQTPLNKPSKVSISSESHTSKKTVVKHYSNTKNVICDKPNSMPVEMNKKDEPFADVLPKQSKHLKTSVDLDEHKEGYFYKAKDSIFKYPKKKLVTVDAHTQYEDSDWQSINNYKHSSCDCRPLKNAYTIPPEHVQAFDNTERYHKPTKHVNRDRHNKLEDVSCQCTFEINSRVDTVLQYEQKYKNGECNCTFNIPTYVEKEPVLDKETTTQCISCANKLKPIQKQLRSSDNETCTLIVSNKNRDKICNCNNSQQTSDNSIDLERHNVRKYPLFMKIVYADKLKEDKSRL